MGLGSWITRGAMLAAGGAALAAAPVTGDWMTPGGQSRVRIGPCTGNKQQLCGNIVWLKQPAGRDGKPFRDVNNPNPALRNRSLVGLPFIYGFKPAGGNRWSGGEIYDPRSGKTYNSKLSLNPDGTLKVEGCILFICRGQTWRRAS